MDVNEPREREVSTKAIEKDNYPNHRKEFTKSQGNLHTKSKIIHLLSIIDKDFEQPMAEGYY